MFSNSVHHTSVHSIAVLIEIDVKNLIDLVKKGHGLDESTDMGGSWGILSHKKFWEIGTLSKVYSGLWPHKMTKWSVYSIWLVMLVA